MEIEEVVKYKALGVEFDSRQEAELFIKSEKVRKDLEGIVDLFSYRGMDADDVIQGILKYKDALVKTLNELSILETYSQCK